MGQLLRWTSTAVSGLCEIQASAKLLRQPDGGGGGALAVASRKTMFVWQVGGQAAAIKLGKADQKSPFPMPE